MKLFKLSFTVLAFLFCFHSISAQEEEMKPKKYDNPEYYVITYLKFDTGKTQSAKKIIKDYFAAAGENAGIPGPAMMLDLVTGEWDMMITWHLKDGPEALNWEISPEDVKWGKAFHELAGSPEKAEEINKEWQSYVKSSKTQLARRYQSSPTK
ncbi:hypothetical protein SAMN04488034_103278 [Salinimicrobium catena]|uniref:NIPSNAP domain-containing protein n=1 Tax=Salinimicrobium catena TaxID=390640 RepID=A0A1H5N253_9FLAO|nr:hypothetical protein [Salinimicrobium catena]SDL34976.1 hypothetical protein SAMN04488140_103278 [Salinimicrobium catena]SEE95664.1 hypothetical protein SAMN04488034_103278 [Salinimicrobium catena]